MKDSKGREYDGWAFKDTRGKLRRFSFRNTRAETRDVYRLRGESAREFWKRMREKWDWPVVKVRLVEVEP